MAPTTRRGGKDPDRLATVLDPEAATALRKWAQSKGGRVSLPGQEWTASGYTGAIVIAILLEVPHPGGGRSVEKRLVKVIPPGQGQETGLHEEARRQNEDFAKRYLARQLDTPWEVGDGRLIMFQEIAGDLLNYRPLDKLDKLGRDFQADSCAIVARLVLADWNGNRLPDRPMLSRAIVRDYLRHELRTSIDNIEQWAAEQGLAQHGAEWISLPAAEDAGRLPNPVQMILSGLSVRRVVVQYLCGLTHGDLHRGNVLVPHREPAPGETAAPVEPDEIRIVDLAGFDPAAPLTRDLVALSLSIAAKEFNSARSEEDADVLLHALLDDGATSPRSSPPEIARGLRAVQRAAEIVPRPYLGEWRAQYLLSLLAGALAHTRYKNLSDAARRWFFHVAARAAAEFLRFAQNKNMIPVEADTDEQLEQVIVTLVSAPADRATAYGLREQLARHAGDKLSWTVDVLLHKEELSESRGDALRSPDVLLYLLSWESSMHAGCRREVRAAASGRVPVIALRLDHTVSRPDFMTAGPLIDVGRDGTDGFDDLTALIAGISDPTLVGQRIEEQLDRTEAEEERADGPQRRRLEIFNREQRVRLEHERRRATGPSQHSDRPEPGNLAAEVVSTHQVRLINEAPSTVEVEFHDRVPEMHRVEDTIASASAGIVVVHGAVGAGKTAFAAELRRRLAVRERVRVDAVVYLSADGYRPITVATILDDLVRSLPDGANKVRLTRRLTDPIEWREKLTDVLDALAATSVVVILDAAEHLLTETGSGTFRDHELTGLIRDLAGRAGHALTLIIAVAGEPPRRLRRELPPDVAFLPLHRGLPFDDAMRFLIGLDRTAALGLSEMTEDERQDVYSLSRGHPRTLELLVGILRQDPGRSLRDLLDDLERQPSSEEVARTLFELTFAQLDRTEQRVVQALAVYGRPVPPAAVDFLLEPSVTGIDSYPVLRGLHDRRIARHDHGHYFLPRAESERVLDGMPRGELDDHSRRRPPFTRFALWHRAATYFERAQPPTINNLQDLRPLFSEIDLRIKAWDYRRALEIMQRVDDDHLRRWGRSDALVDWRRAISGRIGDPDEETHNRSYLVRALQQQEKTEDALAELERARRDCSWLRAPRSRITLNIQMATVRLHAGQLSRAARLFHRHMWQCRLIGGMRGELTITQENLALCLARTGQHSRALRLFTAARQSANDLRYDEQSRILPRLVANHAWALGQIKETEAALALLREGASRASAADEDQVGLGLCLNGEAAVLIDSGVAADAVSLAQRAAEVGVLTGDAHLFRQANLNLGLAYLRLGRDDEALSTAEVSARLDRGPRAVGANGLLGIAAFRLASTDRARLAFHVARAVADKQVQAERNDYQAWDALGLAWFGLALTEWEQRRQHLMNAGDAFERARAITGAAGAVNRNSILLSLFGERADGDLVATMTEVASGARPPFSKG